ncbi:hypothetical protein KCU61_g222, partial [Aureobasidium melanogenum]
MNHGASWEVWWESVFLRLHHTHKRFPTSDLNFSQGGVPQLVGLRLSPSFGACPSLFALCILDLYRVYEFAFFLFSQVFTAELLMRTQSDNLLMSFCNTLMEHGPERLHVRLCSGSRSFVDPLMPLKD